MNRWFIVISDVELDEKQKEQCHRSGYWDYELLTLSEAGKKMLAEERVSCPKEATETAARLLREVNFPPFIKSLKPGQNGVWAIVNLKNPGLQTAVVQLLERACIPCFYWGGEDWVEYPDIAAHYAAHAQSPLEAENPFLPKED